MKGIAHGTVYCYIFFMARRNHTVSLKVLEQVPPQSGQLASDLSQRYSLERLVRQIDNLAGNEPGEIRFFGDDPLDRDDMGSLIQHAISTGFQHVGLSTDGFRLDSDEKLRGLVDSGLNEVVLTIHSTDARVHDYLTHKKGSYQQLLKALEALSKVDVDVRVKIPIWNPRAQNLGRILDELSVRLERISAVELSISQRLPEGKNGERLVPLSLDKLRTDLTAILDEASDQGIPIVFLPGSGVPFCGLPEAYRTPETAPFHPTRPARRDVDNVVGEACNSCFMEKQCSGVRGWYLERYGEEIFEPIAESILPPTESRLAKHFEDPLARARASNVMLKVIRPTIVCNQLCPFCSANETSENSFKTVKKTKKKIIRWYRLGARHLSFSGGEPTLVKELPDYIRLAKQLGYQKIELVTNGTKTSIPKHAKKLVDAGLDVAFISLHADNEELSAKCTGCEGDWEKTVASLHNFQDMGIKVEINHVVSKLNYENLPNFVTWFHNEFGSSIQMSFAFVSPLYRAKDNLWLIPRYSDVMPYLKKAMDMMRSWDHPFVVLARAGIPWCQLRGGYQQYSDLTQIANEAHSEDDYKKNKGEQCKDCTIYDLCPGVFKEYEEIYGMDEFVPLEGSELEVSVKEPVNPWYGIVPDQIETLVRWEHERVDWPAVNDAWEKGCKALQDGDLEEARRQGTFAMGFEEVPALEAVSNEQTSDDVSMQIEDGIRAQGYDRMEEISYIAGLKPVLYLTLPFEQVEKYRARYKGHHVEVVQAEEGESLGNGVATGHAHFFVSKDPEKAQFVAKVYRSGDPTAQAFQVGELMGYPSCCAATFASMADNSSDSENVYAVSERECSEPNPLLNLGMAHIVPFYPCRFDCKEGGAYADQSLAALFPEDEEARAGVIEKMGRPTLYFDKYRSIVFEGSLQDWTVRYDRANFVSRTAEPELEIQLMNLVLGSLFQTSRKLKIATDTWEFIGVGGNTKLQRRKRGPGILLPFARD